jgi:hypothetical protein
VLGSDVLGSDVLGSDVLGSRALGSDMLGGAVSARGPLPCSEDLSERIAPAHYRDGKDSVAFHGDRVGRNAAESIVATVSVGAPRRFLMLLPEWSRNAGGPSLSWALGWGDLFVMGGTLSAHLATRRAQMRSRTASHQYHLPCRMLCSLGVG